MTLEEFGNKFQKKNSFYKYWNYFISILVIINGLFFIYELLFTDWYLIKSKTTINIAPTWLIYIFSGLCILLGLYGFWRIPKTYELTTIESELSVFDKNEIINKIITDFKFNQLESDEQYQHFRYVGRFWNPFDVFIFYDTNNFYINCQQIDYNGGFIDFGASRKVTRKVKNKILSYL